MTDKKKHRPPATPKQIAALEKGQRIRAIRCALGQINIAQRLEPDPELQLAHTALAKAHDIICPRKCPECGTVIPWGWSTCYETGCYIL